MIWRSSRWRRSGSLFVSCLSFLFLITANIPCSKQESKLAKVLKRIALLKDGVIPDDEKYKFRQRSSDLAAKWASIMQENGDSSPKAEAASTDAAPATTENGTEAAPAESEAAAPAEEESKEEKEEDESAPMEVETNGGDKPEESKTEEEEPKKDAEESTSA